MSGEAGELPYPVARALRVLRTTGDERRRLDEVGNAMEIVVVWLGVIGLAWCTERGVRPPGVARWATEISRGGVSNGHWIAATRDAAIAAGEAGEPLAGYTAALQPGKRSVLRQLELFSQRRNELVHGARLSTTRDFRNAADALTEILESVLEGASFLRETELVVVERSSFQRSGDFRTGFWVASGEHPDFEREDRLGPRPYIERGVYLLSVLADGGDLELSPFAVSRDCTQCGNSEMYYPSRVRNDRTHLLSFDKGHSYEDREITAELMALSDENASTGAGSAVPTDAGGNRASKGAGRAPVAPSTRSRAPNVVTRLKSSALLPPETLLRFNLGAVPKAHRDEVGRWLAEDPLRAMAAWTGSEPKPLRWEFDGTEHSLSGLAQHVLATSAEVSLSLQGPQFWVDESGTTLLDLAEAAVDGDSPSADDAQAQQVSAWCVIPEEDDDWSWSIVVRNGSEAPIYDARAWIPQRMIVGRDHEGRWFGAMHDVVPPKREATSNFGDWPLEEPWFTPKVTLEFTDARGQHWRRTERAVTPLAHRAIEPLVNDESLRWLEM